MNQFHIHRSKYTVVSLFKYGSRNRWGVDSDVCFGLISSSVSQYFFIGEIPRFLMARVPGKIRTARTERKTRCVVKSGNLSLPSVFFILGVNSREISIILSTATEKNDPRSIRTKSQRNPRARIRTGSDPDPRPARIIPPGRGCGVEKKRALAPLLRLQLPLHRQRGLLLTMSLSGYPESIAPPCLRKYLLSRVSPGSRQDRLICN